MDQCQWETVGLLFQVKELFGKIQLILLVNSCLCKKTNYLFEILPRYLTLEEQYKFLKSLAKQYEHVQLKVVINENWENDDKNIARKVVITEIEKMMTKRLHLINF